MQGSEGGTTRIYKFGCGQPAQVPAEAELQLQLEAEYWNALVAIEHEYRQRERMVWRTIGAVEEIAEALEGTLGELDRIRTLIAEARRGGQVGDSAWQAQAQTLEKRRRELQRRLNAAKSAHWQAASAGMAALGFWRRETARATYGAFSRRGLYWGNAQLVRDRYEAARRRTERARTKSGRPAELHPRACDGTGFWAVRLQHEARDAKAPCTMRRLFSKDAKWSRMLQIDPVDFSDWAHLPRCERRSRSRTRVRIRVASVGRAPIWLELPMVMHRPLPEEGVVKAAEITRRRVGSHVAYALALTVHTEDRTEITFAHGNTLAVALGCEPRRDGLRVAVCLGSDGARQELVLPNRLLARFHTLDQLASLRSRGHRAAVQEMEAWCGAHQPLVPAWLDEGLRSPTSNASETLRALAEHWRLHRFLGDETAFPRLEAWRKRDKRLLEWQANLWEKCLGFREDLYRTFAHQMASGHDRVVIHKPVLQHLRERPMAETRDSPRQMSSRRLTQMAALFSLQKAIEQAFAKAGRGRCVTPRDLQVGRHFRCDESHAQTGCEVVRCPTCNQLFDRELNTCRQLLQWAVTSG